MKALSVLLCLLVTLSATHALAIPAPASSTALHSPPTKRALAPRAFCGLGKDKKKCPPTSGRPKAKAAASPRIPPARPNTPTGQPLLGERNPTNPKYFQGSSGVILNPDFRDPKGRTAKERLGTHWPKTKDKSHLPQELQNHVVRVP